MSHFDHQYYREKAMAIEQRNRKNVQVYTVVFLIILVMSIAWFAFYLSGWVIDDDYMGIAIEDGVVVSALLPGRHRGIEADYTIISRDRYDYAIDFAVNLTNYIRSIPGGMELNYNGIAEVLAAGFMLELYDDMYAFVDRIIRDLTLTSSEDME